MKKVILLTAILALVVSVGGYAISGGFGNGGSMMGSTGNSGGYSMMGSGGGHMMGSHWAGNQGEAPMNPETGQPYTQEEWNQAVQQMHNSCGSFMGYDTGTEL